ncbi:phosphohistidine phosphatase SixA [Microbulbifer thermotolerans]|uniref:Phosphohistidine phosphatase SixA n=1 Tax=Microbulbifer thermotolerans TaxID=252514 RepID=A0A143HK89_MICTH|nr:phosphohistidine phosphatase SixA [Microbulbifer thermotolerans]AMX02128.1 phosphohistidine phosphatase SixA [Microbulbifer thermotolerans]MCX2778911.1 phosphohistidine phosphatase SixA [Microbulbifer thermotolerans]MCX2781457.1 phosphohistidine phosphatase SixA [Microbulbifer thermotolerans]MCX2793797.1 phosphohistidine phosphatase SixA [Microbulbifer thermotolerans]MCX2802357.1 phosphohistidine phosphatase SixA [Microbulbifer thermotolerans]
MQLLILRHGEAEPVRGDDAARQLTERGREAVARVCEMRAAELAGVRAIWASPFIRTQQTARIVADLLGLPVKTESLLIGDTPPELVLNALQQVDTASYPLLLVSHQPLVGRLVNGVCGSGNRHPMGTSSLACLRAPVWADSCGELEWLQHAY